MARFANENYDKDSSDYKARLTQEIKLLEEIAKRSAKKEQELSTLRKALHQLESKENIAADIENQKLAAQYRREALLDDQNKVLGLAKAGAEEIKNKIKEGLTVDLSQTLANFASSLTSQLDPIIDNYVKEQQAMEAHLVGSSSTLSSITEHLQDALSASKLVQQEKVYSNLATLVKQGILYNAEQRAFLQTIAQDIDSTFNVANNKLLQLIQIQQKDSTANKLAIEYSLQTFLNQNYQTSAYIKEAFNTVSEALFETQSLMSTTSGLQLEATLQTWLGSMSGAGVSTSTVSSLAESINKLGSGNVDGIGQGISNLILMGVARSGLDYGKLLTEGIDASDVNDIMAGVTTYLGEMGAHSSNVVKSQLSSIFGVNVADLMAIGNLKATQGGATTDISEALLNNYGSIVPLATQITNVLNNAMYSWGTNIASSPLSLISYKAEKLVANTLGSLLEGVETTIGFGGSGLTTNLGLLAKAAPLITLMPTLFQTLFGDVIPSISGGGLSDNLTGLFNTLAGNDFGTIKSAGGGLGTTSGATTSGSMYMGNGSSSDILNNNNSSMNNFMSENYSSDEESYTATDIYKKILEWGIIPENKYKISDTDNVVRVSYAEEDPMLLHTMSIDNNVGLLVAKLSDVLSVVGTISAKADNSTSYGTNRYSGLA